MTTDQAANYGTLAGVFLVALFAQWNARKARQTASEAKDRTTEIHNLVNGGRLQDLTKLVNLSKRLAEMTNAQVDAEAYEIALKDLKVHQSKFTKEP